jgi:lipoprotein-releasing system permease protein
VYQALLTRRYLTTKIMPLLAALAVTLCVATELIVWSVMGGFLVQFVDAGRRLVGDVSISWPIAGFAHYEDLQKRLEADPAMVAATTPVIQTYGLISLPDGRMEYVSVKAVDAVSYAKVTDYASTLHWKRIETPNRKDKLEEDWRLGDLAKLHKLIDWSDASEADLRAADRKTWEEMEDDGLRMSEVDPKTGLRVPAVVLGMEVSGFNMRREGNWYGLALRVRRMPDGSEQEVRTFLPSGRVTLSVLPLDEGGKVVDFVSRSFPVANEFETGLLAVDQQTVLADLGAVQRMMKLGSAARVSAAAAPAEVVVDEQGRERFASPEVVGESAARVTSVNVKAAPGVTAEALLEHCKGVYAEFAQAHGGRVPDRYSILIRTWRSENAVFIGAVEKETQLVMFIFGIISLTSVFLVLAIFWAMVSEKTRDIGVLRAVGAGKFGVASIWLTYGLLIGIVGAALGTGMAYLIVTNINEIHEWMGRALGLQIWDPSIYYFITIPHKVNPTHAWIVVTGGLTASVLGALWPALRAANMDPVQALRFE